MNHYDNPEFFAAYAQMSRSQQGLDGAGEWHQLQSLFPDLTGKDMLDLGCGYGWHCKYAANHGARSVLGIDQSEMMIAKAKKRNAHEKIDYSVCSLQEYDYPKDSFDLVISNLVLHYVEDLDAVYRSIHETLRPGGVFLMNIEHPTFTAGVNQQFAKDGSFLHGFFNRLATQHHDIRLNTATPRPSAAILGLLTGGVLLSLFTYLRHTSSS